jgi:hypothetical protein
MTAMSLIERAKNIVLAPKTEWPAIAAETTTTKQLYVGYIIPLAAIGPIAQFIGLTLIGISIPFLGSYRLPLVGAITSAIVFYVLALISVFIISLIIDALAPSFGSEKNPMQALKLAAYAYTPAWLASILHIVPALGLLVLLAALYGVYVLYLGLPILMKTPQDKAMGYTAVIILCAFVVGAVVSAVASSVGGMGVGFGGGRFGGVGAAALAARSMDAGGLHRDQVNAMSAQIEMAARKMEAAQKSGDTQAQAAAATSALAAVATGGVQVDSVDQNILKTMLPDNVAGLPRTSFEASKAGIAGMQVSKAEADYGNGQGTTAKLEITDIGGATMFAALAAWSLVEQDKENDSGYEKMGKADGRPFHEVFNKNGPQSEYTVLVGGRFLVEARGSRLDMDAVKKAVASVDLGKLESMKDVGVKKTN